MCAELLIAFNASGVVLSAKSTKSARVLVGAFPEINNVPLLNNQRFNIE